MTLRSASSCSRPSLWAVGVLAALAIAAIPVAALLAQPGAAPFTIAESGEGYAQLQDAVDAIGGGSGTILFAPGTYNQCAVQQAGRITYRAREFGTATLAGQACEGKAALVLDGEEATVIGLVFADISVPDRNGAGIRLQRGELAVTQSWFRDSEQGILTHAGDDIRLRVDKSTFTRLGTCEGDGGCAHSIYTGAIAETAVTRSRYEQGTGGHYLKSRAARTVVEDLGGYGLYGVEFFVRGEEVIFSELSPRPHDTGMVTLLSQNLSEFDLHARAVMGLPIPEPIRARPAASAVILADRGSASLRYNGLAEAVAEGADIRIFGKPTARPYRRMGVALATGADTDAAREAARKAADLVEIHYD